MKTRTRDNYCYMCGATKDVKRAVIHVSFEWRGAPQDGETIEGRCALCAEEDPNFAEWEEA